MSKPMRMLRNAAIGLAAFVIVAVVAVTLVVRTDWFHDYVRQKIITATEEGTGGKVDIGSFAFDWKRLRVSVTNFVIHGDEPPGSAPFVRAARVELVIRLFTSLSHVFDIAYLGIDQPQANIMIYPDGRTNIPTPKQKSDSNGTALETVVDLAVGHFELNHGLFTFNSQQHPLDVRANNVHAQVLFNPLNTGYRGEISLQPLYVAAGRNTPVNFTLTLPVTLQRDRVEFQNARVSTNGSEILINGSLENLRDPKAAAHISGHVALADLKNLSDLPIAVNTRNVPALLDLDANATVSGKLIQVTGLRLGIGRSTIEASGRLKDPDGKGELQFKSDLALGELGRLAKIGARPDGKILLNGTVKLDSGDNYQVAGNIAAQGLSFSQGNQRISNVNLFSAMRVDPHHIELDGLRLAAFGGELLGNASLEDFARYKLNGHLRSFDLKTAARALGQKDLPYSGVVAGSVEASGDLNTPGTKSIAGHVAISIAPVRTGIPVSGQLRANYSGAADNIYLNDSYIALPHTRFNLSGSLDKQLSFVLTTQDLNDLLAAAHLKGNSPVSLNGGQARFSGLVMGSLTAPRIVGHLAVSRLSVEGRQFDSLAADLTASRSRAAVSNGSLKRNSMQAQFAASVGLKKWGSTPTQPLVADASIQNGDLADILALAGQPSAGYSGALSLTAHAGGTIGNPTGQASLDVASGTILDEPFDRIHAQINMTDQRITVPSAYIAAGVARVTLTADFEHPRDSVTTGRAHAHVDSNQIDLAQLRTLQKDRPNTAGLVQLQADVIGNLTEAKGSEFMLTCVTADVSARNLRSEGQTYGDFTAQARTNAQAVNYNIVSDFAGSNIRLNGKTQLSPGYPTSADARIGKLPIERVLTVAKRTDIPAKGSLSGTVHFSGTKDKPEGSVDLTVANGVLYDEPIDRLRARVTYLAQSIDAQQFEVAAGTSHLELTARYDHPAGDLQTGDLQFKVNSDRIDLTKVHNVQKIRSGLGGTVQITANGAAAICQGSPRVLLRDVKANVSATGISSNRKSFGDLTLTADTSAGKLDFALKSNLANAAIEGHGNAELSGAYPVDAQFTFKNVLWTRISDLLGSGAGAESNFEAAADGQITVTGPATKTNELHGSFQIARLQFNSLPDSRRNTKPVVIQNQGAITATLDRGMARITSLHLTGPQMDFQASGTFALQDQTMNLSLSANSNLEILKSFDRDVSSSGSVTMSAAVRGAPAKPLVNGKLELHNASFNYLESPTGISNANGAIVFSGSSASIQNLTGESGGGRVTVTGFAAIGNVTRMGLRVSATNVRIRPQQGVSIVADANVNVTGTAQSSVASGTVTVQHITYAPQSDFGSILTRAAPPVQSPTTPSPLLDNMKLDVRVRTSDALAVQASLAQNLQCDADLQIRGTAAQPGVLGRVTINEGKLAFFGSTYTVNSGSVSFYNPTRIEPVLNISLETQAKGVDVSLTVTGPIDNMIFSYTSDPPLQFQEIIGLLASGRTPTSDPNILVNQPSAPAQSVGQMGESALVGAALADPVSNRLQRVFGISQLKVDPTFTSGSELPQARMTLQQQVSSNLTLTYVTALDDPNTQIIRAEWAFNRQWSAIATRDQNGIVSVNFFYKKQFR